MIATRFELNHAIAPEASLPLRRIRSFDEFLQSLIIRTVARVRRSFALGTGRLLACWASGDIIVVQIIRNESIAEPRVAVCSVLSAEFIVPRLELLRHS